MQHPQSCGAPAETATEPLPERDVEPAECAALIDPDSLELRLRWPAAVFCCVPPLKLAMLAGVAAVPTAAGLGRDEPLESAAGARVAAP